MRNRRDVSYPNPAECRPGASSPAVPLLVAPILSSLPDPPFLSSVSSETELLRSPRAARLASAQGVAVQAGQSAQKAAQAAVAAAVTTSSLIDEMRQDNRQVCGDCSPARSSNSSAMGETLPLDYCSFFRGSPCANILSPSLPLSPSSQSLPHPHRLCRGRTAPFHGAPDPSSFSVCSDYRPSPDGGTVLLPSSFSGCTQCTCSKCSPERDALVQELARKTAALEEEMTSRFQEELAEERRRVTVELERQRQHLIHHEEELRLLHSQVRPSAQQNSSSPSVSRKLLGVKGSRSGARLGGISTVTGVATGTKRKVVVVSSQSGVRTRTVDNTVVCNAVVGKDGGGRADTQRDLSSPIEDAQAAALSSFKTEIARAEHEADEVARAGLASSPVTSQCGRNAIRSADNGVLLAGEEDAFSEERAEEKSQEGALDTTALSERGDVFCSPSQSATGTGQLRRVKRGDVEGGSLKQGTEKQARGDTASQGLPDSLNDCHTRGDFKQRNDVFRRGVSILSNYVMKQKIGCGTWGDVFIAIERASGLQRAVKRISKRSSKAMKHAEDEMVLLQRLDHPNIIKVYECYEDYSYVYIVMELCRGGDLYDTILRRACFRAAAPRVSPSPSQPPDPQAGSLFRPPFDEIGTAVLMHQILSAVHYCHCHAIAHRDIKPENFLLTSPNSFQLKLIDFGLARSFLYDLDEPPSCSGRQLSGRQAPAGFRRDLSGTRETDSSPSVDRPAGSPVSGHHTIGHKASASAEGSFPRSPRGRESVEATERQRLREGSEEGWSRRGYSAFPHHRLVRPLHSLVGTMHFAAPEILSLSVRNLFLAKPSSLRALNKNERFPVEEVRENPKEGKARGACSYLPRKKAGEKEESNDERDKSPKKGSDGGSLAGKELQCMFGYDGRYADSWSCGVLFYLLLSGDLPFTGDSDVEVLQQMLRGAPVFSGAVWQDVSAVAKDLIIRLLTVPPSTRLLPGEALQHPFFRLFLPHSVPLRLYASPGALARRPSFPSFPASSARTESCALLQRALPLASPIMHLSAPAPLNLSTCLSHHSIQFSPLIGLGLSCPGHGFFPAFSSVVSFRDVPTSLSQNSGTQLRYDLAASRDFKSGRDHSAVWAFRRCRSESSICCTCCSVREQTGVYQQQFACPSLPLLPGGVFPGNVVRRPSLYMSGGSSPGTAELLSLTHQLSDVSIDTFSQSSPRGDDEQEFSKFLVRAESATQKPVVPHSTGITLNSVPHSGSSGVHVARSVAAFKAHRQALPPCGSVPHLLGRGVAGHCGGEAGADSQSAATKKKKGRKKEGALEAAALISRLTEDSSVLVAPSASGRGRHEGPAAFLYLPGGCEFQRKVTLPQGERELSETNLAQHEWQQTHEDIAEEIGDGGDVFALSTAYICWCRAPAGRHQQADSHSQQHQLQRLDSGTATNAHHGEGAKSWQEKSSSCQTTEVQRRANGKREEEKAEMESERWESRAGKERRGSGSSCSSGQSGAEQDDSDCSSEVSEVKTEAEPEEPLPPAVSAAFSFPAVAVPPVFHPRAAHLRSSYPAGDLASDPSSPSSDAPRSGAADALLLAPPVCVGKCPSNSAGRDRSSSASSDDSAADESAVAGVSSSAVVAAALQFQQPCAPFFPLGEMLDPPPVVTEGCLIASDKQVLVYSPRTTTAAAIAAVRSVQTPNLAASRLSRKINQDLYGLEKVCGASLSPARGTADPDIGKTGRPGGSASGMPAPTAITGPLLDFSVPSAGQTLEGRAERGQAVATTERRQGKPAMVGGSPALLGTNCLCALHQTAIQAGTEAAAATLMAIGGVYVDARSIRLRAAAGDEADSRSQSEGSGDVPVLRLPQHPLSSILSTRSRMLSGRWTSPPECPHTSPGRDASMCGRGAAIPYDFPGTQAVFSSPDCLDGLSKRQEQELSYLLCFPIPHIHVPCANPSPAANSSEPLRRQESAANFSTSRAGDGSSTGVPHRSQLWLLSPQDVKLFPFCPLAPVLFQRWIVYSQKSLLQKKCALLVVEMARGDLANAALTASGPSGRSVSAILGGRGMSRHSSSNVAASAGGRNTSFSRGLYGSSAPLSFPAEKLEGSDCAMEQLQRLEGLFLLLDGDGDGLLTLRELVTGVQRLSLLLRVKLKVDRARKKEAQNLLRLRRERLEEVANEVSAAEAVLQRQKEFLLSCAKFASSKSSTVSAVVKHKGRASIIGEGSPAAKSGSERGGSARPRDPDSPRFVDGEPEEGCTEQGGLGHERPDRAREERRRRRMRLLKMCGEEAGLAQMESCLRECDANKDGVIDLTEFLTACADERLFVRQELLRAAFRKLDFEGRGFLSVEEVKSALGWGDGTAVVAEINATKSRWVPERTGQCEGHEHEAPEKQLQSAELGAPRFTFEDFVACLQAP